MIVLPTEILAKLLVSQGRLSLRLCRRDGGQVYSALAGSQAGATVAGSLRQVPTLDSALPDDGCEGEAEVCVLACRQEAGSAEGPDRPAAGGDWKAKGFTRREGGWDEVPVDLVPVREDLFSRSRGLFETDVLAGKRVFTAGLGSGGAPIVMELAKLGIDQIIMDHDRVEVANVGRHVLGLSDVGRFKATAMAERILDKNPYADVEACTEKITWGQEARVGEYIDRSDLTICAVDEHDARVILNKNCVERGKSLIMAATFRRAYGGQVLVVRPGVGPCYQCFLQTLPEQARDQEISSVHDAERLAYSDRPVPIEPGLATDIAPMSLMVAKLVIQHLLKEQETTLRSLDADLAAPWYLWLNRREGDTQYAELPPMSYNLDGLAVLRWYGLPLDREEGCPCCGDFVAVAAREKGISIGSARPADCYGQGSEE